MYTHAGSSNYLIELIHFSRDEFDERIKNDELDMISDDHGQLSMKTVIKPGLMAPGGNRSDKAAEGVCRGNFPEDYSILIKFSYEGEKISFNFLNITNQLSISLDNCERDKPHLVIKFMSCSKTFDSILPSMESGQFYKIGIQVHGGMLSVSFNCTKLGDVVSIGTCPVLCDAGVDVHMMQPNASSSCDSEKVREIVFLYLCSYVHKIWFCRSK